MEFPLSADSTMTPAQAGTDTSGASPGGRHLGLALFVIAAAQLMVILDATISNIALPAIQTARANQSARAGRDGGLYPVKRED